MIKVAEEKTAEEKPKLRGNQRHGVMEDMVLHWRRFDAMPKELREVYSRAPFNMHMGNAAKRLDVYQRRLGASVLNMRKAEIFYIAKHLQERCEEMYGPDHPDAQRSRLEGRARRTMRHPGTASGGRA